MAELLRYSQLYRKPTGCPCDSCQRQVIFACSTAATCEPYQAYLAALKTAPVKPCETCNRLPECLIVDRSAACHAYLVWEDARADWEDAILTRSAPRGEEPAPDAHLEMAYEDRTYLEEDQE